MKRERDGLRQVLRIGIQWQTQVTLRDATHLVSQAYCSALPVAYTPHAARLWAPFAQLILEAAYEATLCAAIVNARRHGNHRVFLTLLGGGAFGNDPAWIIAAIARAVHLYQQADLDRRPRQLWLADTRAPAPAASHPSMGHRDRTRACNRLPAACARVSCGVRPPAATGWHGTPAGARPAAQRHPPLPRPRST